MGFSYLKDKEGVELNWHDVTRDERTFCAELYFVIKQDVLQFVKWLDEKVSLQLTEDELKSEWEIGFEVCFYRDVRKLQNNPVKGSGFSQKRTFDLCLFSENRIIVIEAKSQTGFGGDQNDEFDKDPENILKLLNRTPNDLLVNVVGLASSRYLNSPKRKELPECFAGRSFSWSDVFHAYCRRQVFLDADNCYGK